MKIVEKQTETLVDLDQHSISRTTSVQSLELSCDEDDFSEKSDSWASASHASTVEDIIPKNTSVLNEYYLLVVKRRTKDKKTGTGRLPSKKLLKEKATGTSWNKKCLKNASKVRPTTDKVVYCCKCLNYAKILAENAFAQHCSPCSAVKKDVKPSMVNKGVNCVVINKEVPMKEEILEPFEVKKKTLKLRPFTCALSNVNLPVYYLGSSNFKEEAEKTTNTTEEFQDCSFEGKTTKDVSKSQQTFKKTERNKKKSKFTPTLNNFLDESQMLNLTLLGDRKIVKDDKKIQEDNLVNALSDINDGKPPDKVFTWSCTKLNPKDSIFVMPGKVGSFIRRERWKMPKPPFRVPHKCPARNICGQKFPRNKLQESSAQLTKSKMQSDAQMSSVASSKASSSSYPLNGQYSHYNVSNNMFGPSNANLVPSTAYCYDGKLLMPYKM